MLCIHIFWSFEALCYEGFNFHFNSLRMCYRSPYYYSYDNLKKGMMCWFQWFPCVVSFPCSFTNERIEVAVHSKMSLLVWLRFLMVEMLLLLREISREITMKPLKYFPVKWQWKVFFRQCSMYQPGSTNTMWQSHDAYIQLITTVVQTLPKASELFYANSMHCGSFWFFCILKSLYVLSFFYTGWSSIIHFWDLLHPISATNGSV